MSVSPGRYSAAIDGDFVAFLKWHRNDSHATPNSTWAHFNRRVGTAGEIGIGHESEAARGGRDNDVHRHR